MKGCIRNRGKKYEVVVTIGKHPITGKRIQKTKSGLTRKRDANPPAVKTKEAKIWSFNEIHTFLAHCKEERHYITFLLAIYTGMRRGEILGLKWSNIDFEKKIIRVERTLIHIPGNGY